MERSSRLILPSWSTSRTSNADRRPGFLVEEMLVLLPVGHMVMRENVGEIGRELRRVLREGIK